MKINGKEYKIPELNFNTMCILEDQGVSLTSMDEKMLSTVRGFVSLAMGGDFDRAGDEIEAHLANGGNFDEIIKEIEGAVKESGFFRALSKNQTQGNTTSKSKTTSKAE